MIAIYLSINTLRSFDKISLCRTLNHLPAVNRPSINSHRQRTRPSELGMSDPGVEPLEILEIMELETPPYPRPPCRCPPCRLVR